MSSIDGSGTPTSRTRMASPSWLERRCPKPLKNGVVVTRRSLQVEDGYHTVINFSIRHLKYPPCEELTAVSLPAGYLAHSTGPNSCSLTYLAQVDPKGLSEIPCLEAAARQ